MYVNMQHMECLGIVNSLANEWWFSKGYPCWARKLLDMAKSPLPRACGISSIELPWCSKRFFSTHEGIGPEVYRLSHSE